MHRTRALIALLFLAVACRNEETRPAPTPPAAPSWPRLAGAGPMRIPADNPLTPEKVRLGKRLFFDVRLSGDGSTSCSG
ncbi:MAG TPA: cytochrome c peroxidase, partial [Thermoanaerobaculia bacterium]|nr:cytochrome c peroxidase [Thermoanaerobaculia bacterium]